MRVTGSKHFVGVLLRFNTADITDPGVACKPCGHSYRRQPVQRARNTQRRTKWYQNKQKEHREGDVTNTILPFQVTQIPRC